MIGLNTTWLFEKMSRGDIFKLISNTSCYCENNDPMPAGIFSFPVNVLQGSVADENTTVKDTIIYRITYCDTIIYSYKYDTVRVRHCVHSDTLWSPAPAAACDAPVKKRKVINPNNFGIGPSVGAYYSPFNGFDINIGFGVQYYFLSIPTIRKPHLHHHRK